MTAKTNDPSRDDDSAAPVLLDYAAARADLPTPRLSDWIERFPAHAEELLDLELLLAQVAAGPVAAKTAALDPLGQRTFAKVLDEVLGPAPAFAGVVARARALGLTLTQLGERLGLRNATDLLLSLDKRLLTDLPQTLIARLSQVLACEIDEVRCFFSDGPVFRAAAFHNAPNGLKNLRKQSFREAIEQSPNLSAADRQEWLRILDAEPTSSA